MGERGGERESGGRREREEEEEEEKGRRGRWVERTHADAPIRKN